MNTKVSLCGITLDNPVIPASGTFAAPIRGRSLNSPRCASSTASMV